MIEKGPGKAAVITGRVLITILTGLLVIVAPWWVYIPVILFLIFFFNIYFEAIIIGLFMDALYGSPFTAFPALFTAGATLFVVATLVIRDRFRW